LLGVFFLTVGALGLARLPDVLSRLQGASKAVSVGMGFLMLGQLLQSMSLFAVLKLLFVWGLLQVTCSTLGQLVVGRRSLEGQHRR
jgi:monovalent cation/proton antiporter MnhG/PhaG subunit